MSISGITGYHWLGKLIWRDNMSFPIIIKLSLVPNLETDESWSIKYGTKEKRWVSHGFLR